MPFKSNRDSGVYDYEQTLLIGRYRDEMRVFAAENSEPAQFDPPNGGRGVVKRQESTFSRKRVTGLSRWLCRRCKGFSRYLVEDWFFLAALGIIMALLSWVMDWSIEHIHEGHIALFGLTNGSALSTAGRQATAYFSWVSYTVLLVLLSALFVHFMAPQAIGSGIPEMKTILRGVILKEYLTLRTLVSKCVGLTLSLGSGLPIGKEGPFVHVASVVATLLSRMITSFKGSYANESRNSEMLAAACAVGVACTFSAPVGGVLFSIEVTSVYFAVRNYWRGFFAAACSATVFRIMRVLDNEKIETVVAFYQTDFPNEAFVPEELPIFALIGVVCGFAGALFVYLHRSIVMFMRRNKIAKSIFQKNVLVYPGIVALLVSTLSFPNGYGRFIAGQLKFSQALQDFFRNCTFTSTDPHTACPPEMLSHWNDQGNLSPFITITCFLLTFYVITAIANTVPVPAGVFMPVFVLGAGFGRLVGEAMSAWFDGRIRENPSSPPIYPGVYAIVGAASFCGAVTHTVSTSVIVFELTGQIMYILPVMIAVLIANAICAYLQPSIYDSIIKIKHLPYLPDIPPSNSAVHDMRVENIMVRNIQYLSKASTYEELQDLLIAMPRLKAFPVVDDPNTMVLLGSIPRRHLEHLLELHVGAATRKAEARRRLKECLEGARRETRSMPARSRSTSPQTSVTPMTPLHEDSLLVDEDRDRHTDRGGSRFTVVPVSTSSSRGTRVSQQDAVRSSPHQPENDDDDVSQQRSHSQDELVLNKPSFLRSKSPKGSLRRVSEPQTNKVTLKVPSPADSNSLGGPSQDDDFRRRYSSGNNSQQMTVASQLMYNTIEGIRSITRLNWMSTTRKPGKTEPDLHGDERSEWETRRLEMVIDFEALRIDPAPFQLVEQTSLYKVHSLFSLLGLNRAYVTNCGRLIGVVALRELRVALERAQASKLITESPSAITNEETQVTTIAPTPGLLPSDTNNNQDEPTVLDIEVDVDKDKDSKRLESESEQPQEEQFVNNSVEDQTCILQPILEVVENPVAHETGVDADETRDSNPLSELTRQYAELENRRRTESLTSAPSRHTTNRQTPVQQTPKSQGGGGGGASGGDVTAPHRKTSSGKKATEKLPTVTVEQSDE